MVYYLIYIRAVVSGGSQVDLFEVLERFYMPVAKRLEVAVKERHDRSPTAPANPILLHTTGLQKRPAPAHLVELDTYPCESDSKCKVTITLNHKKSGHSPSTSPSSVPGKSSKFHLSSEDATPMAKLNCIAGLVLTYALRID